MDTSLVMMTSKLITLSNALEALPTSLSKSIPSYPMDLLDVKKSTTIKLYGETRR
jgi:hypothetical protein